MAGLRRRYLEAMGIPLWVRRAGASAHAGAGPEAPAAADPGPQPGCRDPDVAGALASLSREVAACTRCALHQGRTQAVFGVGSVDAALMVVGEAPGADEDRQGEPFVGRAGRLLNAMLRAIGLTRGEVYIANIVKCRPPRNRDPAPEEATACEGYLRRQIELVGPRVILAAGRVAAQSLLRTQESVGALRRRRHAYNGVEPGVPVVVTYHPAYLLRSPQQKDKAWADLKLARTMLQEHGEGA